jgi:hypothetical protein
MLRSASSLSLVEGGAQPLLAARARVLVEAVVLGHLVAAEPVNVELAQDACRVSELYAWK